MVVPAKVHSPNGLEPCHTSAGTMIWGLAPVAKSGPRTESGTWGEAALTRGSVFAVAGSWLALSLLQPEVSGPARQH
jgi:hypothetical protein